MGALKSSSIYVATSVLVPYKGFLLEEISCIAIYCYALHGQVFVSGNFTDSVSGMKLKLTEG